ncbi:2-dehydropantoate 2-reductase N-terminal domain-containing protein [Enterobacter vonholyi]|uniref:2-dehydropantoate 2-reductase N-terminal domain-containing protein n=1 Tax=Enterobacter vonholyi TaxID=2797505 RepID=UPI002DBF4EBB|nr:2-dehydropantoate 2-reductase N-terminal domain-containing protein [Enterobacter vonholyi]MEB5977773.1 hypothetical protein [Enterobacter vonholyi]
MSDYPTIALIGPGAIGTTIAAVLHDAGRTPLLCGRTAHPELRLRHDEGETVVPGPVLTDPTAITRPVDLVFVAVKTTQNADSAGWLREDISELSLAYLREGLAVARAEGAKLNDDVAQEILVNFQRAPVDLGTSILADRQADRPMEWDIRNGVIQRYGRKHGIAVPISDVVVPLLAAGSEGPG